MVLAWVRRPGHRRGVRLADVDAPFLAEESMMVSLSEGLSGLFSDHHRISEALPTKCKDSREHTQPSLPVFRLDLNAAFPEEAMVMRVPYAGREACSSGGVLAYQSARALRALQLLAAHCAANSLPSVCLSNQLHILPPLLEPHHDIPSKAEQL
jgi:hypothetical protein